MADSVSDTAPSSCRLKSNCSVISADVSAMAYTFCGLCVVSLIPVPPTDGGRILFTLGPNSPGWGNARYQLQERNFGLAILLGLLMLPILFPGFPSVVGQLAPALYRGLSHVVGLT